MVDVTTSSIARQSVLSVKKSLDAHKDLGGVARAVGQRAMLDFVGAQPRIGLSDEVGTGLDDNCAGRGQGAFKRLNAQGEIIRICASGGFVHFSISEGRFAPSTGERSAQAVKACGGARRRAATSEGIAA